MLVMFYFPELFPELSFFYNHAVVRHLTLFVWVRYYNYILTASFSCTPSYMQHDYILLADILSVLDVIRCQLAYSIASTTKQWN
jgi:hypothetical protein